MPRSVRFARATTDCAASSKEVGLEPMIWLTLLIHIGGRLLRVECDGTTPGPI
jgi:hypothetical protein